MTIAPAKGSAVESPEELPECLHYQCPLLAESGQKKAAALHKALPEILRVTARSELPILFHRGWNVRFRHPYDGDRLHIEPSSGVSLIAVLE